MYIWFPDDSYIAEAEWIDAESAVKLARDITRRPAVQLGIIARVIITDGADCTVFEWINGKGVTFPQPTNN